MFGWVLHPPLHFHNIKDGNQVAEKPSEGFFNLVVWLSSKCASSFYNIKDGNEVVEKPSKGFLNLIVKVETLVEGFIELFLTAYF